MKTDTEKLYSFVFRGLLTEEALDKAGRKVRAGSAVDHEEIAKLLSLDALDEERVEVARGMGTVYVAIAAFENSVRELVTKTLLENLEENWWQEAVSAKIRKQADERMKEEKKVKWHAQRGDDPIQFTMPPD